MIYWVWKELKDKETFHNNQISRCEWLRKYLISKNAIKSENLIDDFSDIFNQEQDIYYINKNLILKTSNSIDNGVKKYPGLFLQMNKGRYYLGSVNNSV